MIKVLKHGNLNGVIYKAMCSRCHCIFTYEIEDAITYFSTNRLGFINCPECGLSNTVSFKSADQVEEAQ